MSQTDAIMEQVAKLSPDERLELRIRLLEADLPVEDEGADAAWAAEVTQRIEAFKRGEVQPIAAEDVLQDARELLAKLRGRDPSSSACRALVSP